MTKAKSFFTFYFLYSIISVFITTGASTGWAGMFIFTAGIFYYGIIGFILFITILASHDIKNLYFKTRLWLLYLCVFLQLGLILGMSGDNGDNPGVSPPFYVRILSADFANPLNANSIKILDAFFGISSILYLALFCVFMFLTIKNRVNKNDSQNNPLPLVPLPPVPIPTLTPQTPSV